MTEDLVELGLIGRQISTKVVRDVPLRVLNFLPLSTVEGGTVKAFSATDPYGVLTVALDIEREGEKILGKAMLPISHRDDARAIHWVFGEANLPDDVEVWVIFSPSGGLLGSMKSSIGIHLVQGDVSRRVKAPGERLDL